MTNFYLYVRRYLTVLFLLTTLVAWSQNRTVTGKVTSSDDGSGIPGVNIIIKGTNTGTVTDADGNFSISASDNSVLVVSFVGYATQEVAVGSQTTVNVSLQVDVTALSEVVVVGYGSQDKKEITSSVSSLSTKDFNIGNINDPMQLLQGKVAGLSVYNRGGNPNSNSVIRLRGISTVGANVQPLIVVDGIIGASLDNVDPNDIESVNVLKDGSAAAIYGSRGSSGVILVTTKKGSTKGGGVSLSYNGYISAATVLQNQPNMSASEYVNAGGNDLGAVTDWQDEVTRTGVSNIHNIAVGGGNETTSFRLSANFRDVQGILEKSGFDQVNFRSNINHKAFDNKLNINFDMSFTNRKSDFSFNEALRYAVLYNPTAPIKFDNGNYFQAILFDNFNPVAIIEQNINEGERRNQNYSARLDYNVTDEIMVSASFGQQFESVLNGEYYSRNSLFRGLNAGGLARRYTSDRSFTLFETFATYSKSFGKIDLDVTGGYSYQEDEFQDIFVEAGNFPSDELGYHALETSGDRLTGTSTGHNRAVFNSNASPENKIVAFFGRVNLTFDKAIFLNASLRREGSSKLGKDNQWGLFPSVGAGVDLNQYLDLGGVDVLKLRVGYGVTGSLPNESGLAQDVYTYSFQAGGSVSKTRDANPDLKWEEKAEINIGVDFGLMSGKLSGTLDVYTRKISDFILERDVDVTVFPSGRQFQNVGELKTNGIELTLNYNVNLGQVTWTPGVVLSSYKTTLEEFIADEQSRANFGSPGQNSTPQIRVAVGEEIGQIWGPVFAGVASNGTPIFKDLNDDGIIKSAPGDALADDGDFQKLGNGIPKMEYGWTNQLTYKNWDLNVFFRGAVGHSLVNHFRGFYEPIDPGAINSYNRISTDKAVDGLTSAQYSSLYVEKAGFFKCDNLTIGYKINTPSTSTLRNFRVYGTVQNLFVITDYTGIDPEPVLVDYGSTDNGGFQGTAPDVLSPGIDRRNNYFTSRTFTLGVSIGL